MFGNRDIKQQGIQNFLTNTQSFYLPVTPDGSTLVYTSFQNGIVSNYEQLESIKVNLMTLGIA